MRDLDVLKKTIESYEELVSAKKLADSRISGISEKITEMESEILEMLVDAGLQNWKSVSGHLFFRKNEKYVGMAPGVEKNAFVEALANSEHFSDLVMPNYNANSLRSRYKEVTENGDEIPEEIRSLLKVTEVTKLGVRKS